MLVLLAYRQLYREYRYIVTVYTVTIATGQCKPSLMPLQAAYMQLISTKEKW